MLTHRERFVRTLTGREVDRVPFIKVFGGTNAMLGEWEAQCPGLTGNVDREIEKARRYIRLGRFIPGPDHFVLSSVPWENYRYFMERLREVVMTTRPDGGAVEQTEVRACGPRTRPA